VALTKIIRQKVQDFVFQKPRTVQEISELIKINWRTADRYIERIGQEEGTIAVQTFREGTRGSLKIAYWINQPQQQSSNIQERLFKLIESSRHKDDFSPFDIYQYLNDEKRRAFIEEDVEKSEKYLDQDLIELILETKEQLLIFSGNLSWVNIEKKNKSFLSGLKELLKNGVSIKILCNIDIASIQNVEKVLELNFHYPKNPIEIKHSEQPLRAFVVDNKFARFKESKNPHNYTLLKRKTYIFYEIKDDSWIEWTKRVFWNLFRSGIPAEKRIKDIWSIQNLK